jgi:hypothetical protein
MAAALCVAATTLVGPAAYAGTPAAAEVDQCARPLAARAGNWFCLGTAARAKAAHDRARRALGLPDAAAGYCRVEGCWTRYSAVSADFAGSGTYGYGKTHLGDVSMYFEVTMNGAQSTSRPVWFESTRGVRDFVIEGDRLYLSSAHPEGKPVSPSKYSFYGPVSAAAHQRISWNPNGYKSYENTTAWASIVHEWTWHDPSSAYPGRWYFYAKSIKLKRQDSGAYFFESESSLPTTPAGSGWVR